MIAALFVALAVDKLLAATPAADSRLDQAEAAFESARTECESVKNDVWKARTLASIALAQAKAGDVSASRQTFAQARQD